MPGHTEGSVVYLYDGRCLFTGDSLAWDFATSDLTAFRDATWYSWSEQIRSLRRLIEHPFEWVLPGHGGSKTLPAAEMRARLAALVEWMPAAGYGPRIAVAHLYNSLARCVVQRPSIPFAP